MDRDRFQQELNKLQQQIDSLGQVFQRAMGDVNQQLRILEQSVADDASIQPQPKPAEVLELSTQDTIAFTPADISKVTPQLEQPAPLPPAVPVAAAQSSAADLSLVPLPEPELDFSARLEIQLEQAPVLGGIDITDSQKKVDLPEEEPEQLVTPAKAVLPEVKPVRARKRIDTPASSEIPAASPRPVYKKRVQSPTEPSWWGVFLGSLFSFIFGPINNLVLKGFELYRHYRDQGKAPVFLMTTAGIVTLLFGFGYLLQYSFVYLLNPPVKLLLCVVAGAGFVVLGNYLSNSKNYLRDYASSLIALGFVIEFLVIYFAADVYQMLSMTPALIFYLLNSAAAMIMAKRHETRVVAAVTLVGGLFVPGFGEHLVVAPTTYCPYVLLVILGSLYLARAIRWKELSVLTLIAFSAATQLYVNSSHLLSDTGYAAYICIAFLAFCFDALWEQGRIKESLHHYDLINSVANLSFFIWASYNFLGDASILKASYSLLALGFCVLMYLHRFNKEVAAILALQAAVLSGAAVAALLGGEVWSLFFSLEAVALIAVGCFYQNAWIRNEGYAALLISIAQLLALVLGAFGNYQLTLFSSAWVSLLACSASVYLSHRILSQYKEDLAAYELGWVSVLDQSVNIAISASILVTAYLVDFYYLYLVSFVPLFVILNRTRRSYSLFSEVFALSHFLLALLGIKVGMDLTHSYKFSMQPWWGKLLRVETLVSLWLIAKFYEKYMLENGIKELAEYPKLAFYGLLPVVLASSIWRHFPEFQGAGFWLSAFFAMVLLKRLSHGLFKFEVVAFVGLAIFSLKAVLLNQLPLPIAAVDVGAGLIFFVALLKSNHAFDRKMAAASELSEFFPVAYHYFSFSAFLLVYKLTNSFGMALMVVGYLNLLYCYRNPPFTPIRGQLKQYYLMAQLVAWGIASGTVSASMDSAGSLLLQYSFVTALLLCFHLLTPAGKLLHRGVSQLWLMHILLIVACSTLLHKMTGDNVNPYLSIVLIIQASVVLLLTLTHPNYRDAAKLSIAIFAVATAKIFLLDMKEASMFEKMVAMIGIGAVLLLSGFIYQKLKLQFDEKRAVAARSWSSD